MLTSISEEPYEFSKLAQIVLYGPIEKRDVSYYEFSGVAAISA